MSARRKSLKLMSVNERRVQRRPRSESTERLAFLRELRPILSSGGTSAAMLQQVARLAARTLCEYCIVDVVERASVRRIEIAHADASLFDRLRAAADPFTPKPGGRIERLIASGEPELGGQVRRGLASSAASSSKRGVRLESKTVRKPSAADLDFWEGFYPVSWVAVPIAVRGAVVAVMTLAAAKTPLRFDSERLEFLQEIAGWCGLALEGRLVAPRADGGAVAEHEYVHNTRTKMRVLDDDAPPSRRTKEAG